MFSTDYDSVAVNSDAVRARNARKRAKRRAKARGESPNFRRIRCVVEMIGCRGGSVYPDSNEWLDYRCCDCLSTLNLPCITPLKHTSNWLLITTHDVSSSVLEYLEVYLENVHQSLTQHTLPRYRATLTVQKGGEEGETTWHGTGVVGIGVADVVAAIRGLL